MKYENQKLDGQSKVNNNIANKNAVSLLTQKKNQLKVDIALNSLARVFYIFTFNSKKRRELKQVNKRLESTIIDFEKDIKYLGNNTPNNISAEGKKLLEPLLIAKERNAQGKKNAAGRTRNIFRVLGAPFYVVNRALKLPIKGLENLEKYLNKKSTKSLKNKRLYQAAIGVTKTLKNAIRVTRLPFYTINNVNKRTKSNLKGVKKQYRNNQHNIEALVQKMGTAPTQTPTSRKSQTTAKSNKQRSTKKKNFSMG